MSAVATAAEAAEQREIVALARDLGRRELTPRALELDLRRPDNADRREGRAGAFPGRGGGRCLARPAARRRGPLTCCEQVLAAKGVVRVRLIRLHDLGLKKRQHVDFDESEREEVFRRVLGELAPTLLAEDPSRAPLIDAALGRPASAIGS